VDDASGDGTLHCLQKLATLYPPHWIRILALEENGGPGHARNVGWEAAREPYIAFLDADDAWHPRKLELQLHWMLAHPEVDLSGHQTCLMKEDDPVSPIIGTAVIDSTIVTPLSKGFMLLSNQLATRSVILKRAITMRFRRRQRAEDFLLWMQLLTVKHTCVRIELPLAFSFQPAFSGDGFSSDIWAHEKDELGALRTLNAEGALSWPVFALATAWSVTKFARRLLIAKWRMRPRSFAAAWPITKRP